jgi:hypothetical protein
MFARSGCERPCEAELVAVGVADVKVPLARWGVARFGLRIEAKGDSAYRIDAYAVVFGKVRHERLNARLW